MKKIKMLNTNLELSNICLGCGDFGGKLSKDEAFEIMDTYVVSGGNFMDTANVYCRWIPGKGNCSEKIIGDWLKSRNAYHKVIVATKGGHYDLENPSIPRVNKKAITKDLEESLKTLGTDCIDFYWLHRDDETKPIEEIIEIMEEFVKSGKIRYYGASNYTLERMQKAKDYAIKNKYQGFSALSNQWSLATVNSQINVKADPSLKSMSPAFYQWHKKYNIPIVPYSATASGFFEKLYRANPIIKNGELISSLDELKMSENIKNNYINKCNISIYEELLKLKKENEVSLYVLSLAYLLNHPFQVFPISSVSRKEQLQDFVKASDIVLDRKIIEGIM